MIRSLLKSVSPLLTNSVQLKVCSQSLLTSTSICMQDRDRYQKKPLPIDQQESVENDLSIEDAITDAGITTPSLDTSMMIIDGTRYDELPIVNIHSSLNNTIILVSDHKCKDHIARSSCGTEGFRNVKKRTSVAAQATGLTVGNRILKKDINHVRVIVKGLGVGRLAAMKGLQMAGVNIVSITDKTVIPMNGPRPRKARRI